MEKEIIKLRISKEEDKRTLIIILADNGYKAWDESVDRFPSRPIYYVAFEKKECKEIE